MDPRRVCLLLVAVVLPLTAQLNRGTFTGAVTDNSGAVIPGARVTVTNVETHATFKAGTTGAGQYHLANLPPGRYDLTFEADGFKRTVRRGISLAATQVLRVDVTLEVGSLSEAITVTSEVSHIQTETPETGTSMSGQDLLEMPISLVGARLPDNLATKIVPGVQGSGWETNINGSTGFSKETLLDGASVSTYLSGGFAESSVSMEAISEMRVQTGGISAEFGRTQSGVFNYTMKSGTNAIHGSAYGALRNEFFNANGFSNNYYGRRRAYQRQFDYAGSFGGPVMLPKVYNGRNKSFFYAAYEHYRERNFRMSTASTTLPLAEFYDGDLSKLLTLGNGGQIYDPATFAQLPDGSWTGSVFPNNIIPKSRISRVSQKLNEIAKAHYLPNAPDVSGKIPVQRNTFGYESNKPALDQYNFSLKGDHNINDYHHLSSTYSYTLRPRTLIIGSGMWNFSEENGGPLSRARLQRIKSQLARVAYDWTISPTMLHHTNISYNRMANPLRSAWSHINGAAELGITNLRTDGYPRVEWGSGPNVTFNTPGYPENMMEAYVGWGFLETLSITRGRHFLKMGFDVRGNHENARPSQNVQFNFSPYTTAIPNDPNAGRRYGHAFASYLLGMVNSVTMSDPVGLGSRRYYYAAFINDDFKVSDRLTLQLGLRWDYQPPYTEVADRNSSWSPTAVDPASGLRGAYVFAGNCASGCTGKSHFGKKNYRNFAPRVGFAYRLARKWTVRGAYTIMYEADLFNHYGGSPLGIQTTVGFVGTYNYNADPVQPWAPIFNWDAGLPLGRYTPPQKNPSWGNTSPPGMVDPNYGVTPYVQQWNFNIQHELVPGLIVDVGYLGNKGTRLYNGQLARVNQLPSSVLQQYGANLGKAVRNEAEAAAYGIVYPYAGFHGTVAGALRPYPQVYSNSIVSVYGAPLGFSTYHSLQGQATKRYSNGLTFLANYVWSKSLSNTESSMVNDNPDAVLDYYNLKLQKSLSPADRPHVVKVFVNYELPVGKGKALLADAGRLLNLLVGGWGISGILNYSSGAAIGFRAPTPHSAWNGGGNRPVVVSGQEMMVSGFSKSKWQIADPMSPGNAYINERAFTLPPPYVLGNAAVRYGQARLPVSLNEDLVLQKNIRVREQYRIQLRAEALNAFNRSVLSSVQTDINNVQFGQIRSISGNREVQLVLRLDF